MLFFLIITYHINKRFSLDDFNLMIKNYVQNMYLQNMDILQLKNKQVHLWRNYEKHFLNDLKTSLCRKFSITIDIQYV